MNSSPIKELCDTPPLHGGGRDSGTDCDDPPLFGSENSPSPPRFKKRDTTCDSPLFGSGRGGGGSMGSLCDSPPSLLGDERKRAASFDGTECDSPPLFGLFFFCIFFDLFFFF